MIIKKKSFIFVLKPIICRLRRQDGLFVLSLVSVTLVVIPVSVINALNLIAMEKKENDQLISLIFRIRNESITIDKVNVNQPLSVAVERALKDEEARKSGDWVVTYNGTQVDPSRKVRDLNLTDGALLKLTLKAGGGGGS